MQKENFENIVNTVEMFINRIEIESEIRENLKAINKVSNYLEISIVTLSTFLDVLKSSLKEEEYDYNNSNLYDFMYYINNKISESFNLTKHNQITMF